MDLYPAIDLREGRCVRLIRGSFSQEVRYDTDPEAVAVAFAQAGAPWLHVVDLDAARSGEAHNTAVIAAICRAVDIPVQCGGGVRTPQAAQALADVGVSRVVVGTAAVERPALVSELVASGQPVAVGVDVVGDEVATRGWEHRTGRNWRDVLSRLEASGAAAVIVTQINRDGTGGGPDRHGLAQVLEATSLGVIASGGIGQLQHVEELARLTVGGRQLVGAICGKALYDGKLTIEAALAAAADPTQPQP